MNDLLVVHRYLANNRHKTDDKNPYNVAYQAIDSYLEIEREISAYADKIRKSGGLDWSEAEKLTEHVLSGFEVGIIKHHDSALLAARSFMVKYLDFADIKSLILFCQHQQDRIQSEEREEDEASADENDI